MFYTDRDVLETDRDVFENDRNTLARKNDTWQMSFLDDLELVRV